MNPNTRVWWSMQSYKSKLYFDYDAADGGEGLNLTLIGGGDKVVLKLNKEQRALLESRFARAFYVRCKKEKLLCEIDNAGTYTELEKIAEKYYLCDTCSFGDINLYGVKRILKVVVEILYKYPKLRSKLCFIGTHHGMEKLLARLEEGDKDVLDSFNLQYICTVENAKNLGGFIHKMLAGIISGHDGYIATAMSAYGLFDAILLDRNDYDGYAYLQFISGLRRNEAEGFHPKGCHTPESVVYHELGHLLDDMCALSENSDFKDYYGSLDRDGIKSGLSEYALESPSEFIAEAFAEFMCNPSPRPIAAKVGELLDGVYKTIR